MPKDFNHYYLIIRDFAGVWYYFLHTHNQPNIPRQYHHWLSTLANEVNSSTMTDIEKAKVMVLALSARDRNVLKDENFVQRLMNGHLDCETERYYVQAAITYLDDVEESVIYSSLIQGESK